MSSIYATITAKEHDAPSWQQELYTPMVVEIRCSVEIDFDFELFIIVRFIELIDLYAIGIALLICLLILFPFCYHVRCNGNEIILKSQQH